MFDTDDKDVRHEGFSWFPREVISAIPAWDESLPY